MNPILSQLTVVIPTYNRQEFLHRQISFWGATDCHVEILDGSEKAWGNSSVVKYPNISYNHLPVNIESRLRFVIDKIDTKYAVLLSDDEFYSISALQTCIRELETASDLVACKGVAIGFRYAGGEVIGSVLYPHLRGYKIEHDNPFDRIIEHMSFYQMATLWSVMKVDSFKRCLMAISSGPYSSAAVGEIAYSLTAAWLGKCKVIDELMWFRSFENKNIWNSFGHLSVEDWYTNEKFRNEVDRFLSATVAAVQVDQTTIPRLENKFEEALRTYISHIELSKRPSSKSILGKVRSFLSGSTHNRSYDINELLFRFRRAGTVVDEESCVVIIESIRNFYQISVDQASI